MITTTKAGRKRSVRTVEEFDRQFADIVKGLTTAERQVYYSILEGNEQDIEDKHDELMEHRYHTKPVSMEQFLEDPYYLGESCETLWPTLRKDLIAMFDAPYREVVQTGGIGVGKTFSLSIAICRVLYELSCLVNPQKTFGLSSGTEMVIPLISKNLILAREIMKSAVDDKIKDSPYFMRHFRPSIKREYTLFPNNIRMIIGSYGSERILGANVFSAGLDETNFPPKRKAQQITTGFGQKASAAHYDVVEKVYRSLIRRIKSRFQKSGGDFPGMVILASSAATVESFTERKLKEAADDPSVFVRDHTPWTAKPRDNFSGDWFYVLCSTSSLKARILEEDEYDRVTDEFLEENEAWIIEVPEEYRSDFETDMENALRDIAGISTQAISSFIQRVNTVDECVVERDHPFSEEEWVAGGPGKFDWNVLCKEYERKLPGGFKEVAWTPKLNSGTLRWCHIDTSLSGDSSGLCVGHIDRWVEVVRRDNDNNRHVDVAPYYILDIILRINPPPAEQIYLPDLRTLIYQLMAHGFSFMGFSTDTYQYAEMHQQVKRRGVHCELISMDNSVEPYNELKSAVYEKRIEYYPYEPFIAELKALEYDRVVGKIDHPVAGSKDVSDAVAGVIYGLHEGAQRLPAEAGPDKAKTIANEHAWVTNKIPAGKVDIDEIRTIKEQRDEDVDFMPIVFGDD